jgi:hypothetical protein
LIDANTKKKHISNAVYGVDWYKCDGQYSKGKIHCGCGLCKFGKRYGLPAIRDKNIPTGIKVFQYLIFLWEYFLFQLITLPYFVVD